MDVGAPVRLPGLRSGGVCVHNNMVLRDLVGDVLRTLWSHKLRTFLSILGIIIGVSAVIILMSLELMLNAANLSLVAFSRFRLNAAGIPNYSAQVFVFFIITVAAAEVAVGLAIIVALYRARQTTHVEDISSLKF